MKKGKKRIENGFDVEMIIKLTPWGRKPHICGLVLSQLLTDLDMYLMML
jgi:hypothetical protein